MITWTTLEEVVLPLTRRSPLQQGWSPQCEPQPAEDEAWGVLKTTAIQAGRFLEDANKRLPDSLEPRPALEVAPGDLLITCAGPRSRCGVPTFVRRTRPRLMLSGKMYRLRTTPDLDPRFLEYYLLSHQAQQAIDGMKTGISESGLNLTKDRFLGLAVPVAPLDEQRRLIEILDDLLSRIDAGADYLRASTLRCDRLIDSWLRRSLDPGAAKSRRLGDVIAESRGGWSRSRSHLVEPSEGTPYLKMGNIARSGDLALDDVVHVVATDVDLGKYAIRSGDVLFNSKNSGDLIGKTAVADERVAGWVFNENIMRLRFGPGVDPMYAGLWFLGPQARQQIMRSASASTNVAAVYFQALREFEMWVPDLEAQRRLVAEYRERRAATDRLGYELDVQARRSASMRRSLLAAAFQGRLTGSASDLERVEEMVGV